MRREINLREVGISGLGRDEPSRAIDYREGHLAETLRLTGDVVWLAIRDAQLGTPFLVRDELDFDVGEVAYSDAIKMADSTCRPSVPLLRSCSLDKRELTINPPLPRFGHSPSHRKPPLRSLRAPITLGSEDPSKERIARCRTRKMLLNPPSFATIHNTAEIELKFVKTKPLVSGKRALIRQGEMRKVTSRGSSRRRFFLFSDVLLYGVILPEAKARALGKELDRQITVSIGNLLVEELPGRPCSLWITTEKEQFKVTCASPDICSSWLKDLREVIDAYRSRPSSSLKASTISSFFQPVPALLSPSTDSSSSWVPDSDAPVCMACNVTRFSLLVRRHHCRSCGCVICNRCSRGRTLFSSGTRVCVNCHDSPLPREELSPTLASTSGNLSDTCSDNTLNSLSSTPPAYSTHKPLASSPLKPSICPSHLYPSAHP
ncbi:Pleckstrin y domain-containing F member 2 [Massospora cicadina]|nr:Pleckstrin y domain-containing F member 2 [Massospora cicadina]